MKKVSLKEMCKLRGYKAIYVHDLSEGYEIGDQIDVYDYKGINSLKTIKEEFNGHPCKIEIRCFYNKTNPYMDHWCYTYIN